MRPLCCDHCGFDHLHQCSVDVYVEKEGAEGLHVQVSSPPLGTYPDPEPPWTPVKIDLDMSGNPSGYRYGTVIKLWCEGCHKLSEWEVVQSKGQTYVE